MCATCPNLDPKPHYTSDVLKYFFVFFRLTMQVGVNLHKYFVTQRMPLSLQKCAHELHVRGIGGLCIGPERVHNSHLRTDRARSYPDIVGGWGCLFSVHSIVYHFDNKDVPVELKVLIGQSQ